MKKKKNNYQKIIIFLSKMYGMDQNYIKKYLYKKFCKTNFKIPKKAF